MTAVELAYRENSDGIDERNELVMRELPQVYYVAARIRERLPKQVDLEDLVQAGVIGLLEACRNYDSLKDAQFSTFAKFRIRGAIVDSLRKLDWGSRTLRRRGREINTTVAKLESTLGRQPLEEEIAADMQMTLDELQSTMTQLDGLYLVGQRTSPSHDHADSYDLIESAQSSDDDNPFNVCLQGERRAQLVEAVSQLSEREQLILSLYYKEELTMKEVSKVVGIAVSRVSQIHAAAMVKLRASLNHLRERSKAPAPVPAPVHNLQANYREMDNRQYGRRL
ncbi:MAG: FliA/WhiG family RNA polymerase sigma factor [Terracidiphilus sp.]|jgi:RNA polymerase sigma factor for flagellar operon FliA